MKKNILKIISAVLVFVLIFTGMSLILNYRYTDSIASIKTFYRQPENSIDVLGLGTSHVYEGLSPAVLYDEYGISAYDLCAPAQTVWSSYHYFVEALKTQKPKAVVYDVYMLNTNTEYDTTAYAIKSTYGMKWSKNKVEAINAAFPEENRSKMMIDFFQYHSRYAELTSSDLLPDYGNEPYFGENYKGFITYDNTSPIDAPNIADYTETRKFTEKHEKYFRAIIELAIENKIPIYIVSIPYEIKNDTQKTVNAAEKIVSEYKDSGYVKFIDFNKLYDEMGLDCKKDFSGAQHLNCLGAKKFTSYFGSILKKDLELTDHRGDEKYITWEKNAEVFNRLTVKAELKTVTNRNMYFAVLGTLGEDYLAVVVENTLISDESIEYDELAKLGEAQKIPSDMTEEEYIELLEYRKKAKKVSFEPSDMASVCGIEDAPVTGGAWIIKDGNTEMLGRNDSCFEKYEFFGRRNNLRIQSDIVTPVVDDTYYACALSYNGKDYAISNGVTVLVYDMKLDTLVDCVQAIAASNTLKRVN